LKEARQHLRGKLGKKRQNETVGEFYERMRQAGLKIIREHPEDVLEISLEGTRSFFGGASYILSWLNIDESRPTRKISHSLLLFCYILTAAGMILSLKRGNRTVHLFLISLPVYILLISVTTPGSFVRYRMPVTPIFCLYAAAALGELLKQIRGRNLAREVQTP
jgi:hypothetical protein